MRRKRTALPVLLGCIAFVTVAWNSLSVEGEATGMTTPGFHPTTEEAISALLAREGTQAVEATTVVSVNTAENAAQPNTADSKRVAAKPASSNDAVPPGYVYWKTVRAKVTAYEPGRRSCGKFADGKTSLGQNAWKMDGVATDPKAIPYGCYVVIPGVGSKEVDDTGSGMRDSWQRYRRYHIDLRMPYYGQAKRWGVKHLDVKVYRKAK